MWVRLFGQSRIKIGDKKWYPAKYGKFILPILTWFWKGQLSNITGVIVLSLCLDIQYPSLFPRRVCRGTSI
jgi:hypothetical protein